MYWTLQNCIQTLQYCIHYKFGGECDPSMIARVRLNIDAKVTCITNSDTSSFFIPQPPPPQRPATMLPTCNTHHHKYPWPPTNHDNHPPTKHDNHTPTSPASMTTRAPSTSPAATSCNPHHKQTRLPNLRQPPNQQPHAKKTASGKQCPAPNERH